MSRSAEVKMDRPRVTGSVVLSVLSTLSIVALVVASASGLLLIMRASNPPADLVMGTIPETGPGTVVLEPVNEIGPGAFTAPVAVDLGLDPALLASPPMDPGDLLSPHRRGSTADLLAAGTFGWQVVLRRGAGDQLDISDLRRIAGDAFGLEATLSALDDRNGDGFDDDGSFTLEASDGSAVCIRLGSRRTLALAQGLQLDIDGSATHGYSWNPEGPCAGADGSAGTGPVTGGTAGVFGGAELGDVCDTGALGASLGVAPGLAAEWVAVQGIGPEQLDEFLGELTPVVLLDDTAVTDHRLERSEAVSRQAVLQRGTQVLVDRRGVPVVRCLSGSPLRPPQPLPAVPSFRGVAWPGFRLSLVREIDPAPGLVAEFVLVDIASGEPIRRTPGAVGAPGALAGPIFEPEVLAVGEDP
jgi:hypothetical protein